jgi:hypothetical protein
VHLASCYLGDDTVFYGSTDHCDVLAYTYYIGLFSQILDASTTIESNKPLLSMEAIFQTYLQ